MTSSVVAISEEAYITCKRCAIGSSIGHHPLSLSGFPQVLCPRCNQSQRLSLSSARRTFYAALVAMMSAIAIANAAPWTGAGISWQAPAYFAACLGFDAWIRMRGHGQRGVRYSLRLLGRSWQISGWLRFAGAVLLIFAGVGIVGLSIDRVTTFASAPEYYDPVRAEAFIDETMRRGGAFYPLFLVLSPASFVAAYGILRRRTWGLLVSRLTCLGLILVAMTSELVSGLTFVTGLFLLLAMRSREIRIQTATTG